MTITISACAMLAASGCFELPSERPAFVEQALPTGATLRIDVPESGTAGAGADASAKALGQLADSYVQTRALSRGLNAGAGWVLELVHAVMSVDPASVEFGDDGTGRYTWGPMSEPRDPAEWVLQVTERTDGSLSWQLSGRHKGETGAFLPVIAGDAEPGAEAHRGEGSFSIDFDAAEVLDPEGNDAAGVLDVIYDLTAREDRVARLDMHLDVGADSAGATASFDYTYEERRDGSGELGFGLRADVGEDGSALEDLTIRSRWRADGQGRADLMITGGDLGALTVTASECWDGAFRRVFYADSFELQPTEGAESACAFAAPAPL